MRHLRRERERHRAGIQQIVLVCATIVLVSVGGWAGGRTGLDTAPGSPWIAHGLRTQIGEAPKYLPDSEFDHYEKARRAFSKGTTALAIEHFEAAVKRAPSFFAAHIYLGVIHQDTGNLGEAEQAYLLARKLNPDDRLPPINLSSIYLTRGENRQAVDILLESAALIPSSGAGLYNLGLGLFRLNMLVESEQALFRAREVDPSTSPQATLILAKVYLKMGDKGRLINLLGNYLAEDPTGPDREWVERLLLEIPKLFGDKPTSQR